MHLLIDIGDAIQPFIDDESDSGHLYDQAIDYIKIAIEEELGNVADIFEGLDEGITPEEVPELVKDNYFDPKQYVEGANSMEPGTLLHAEIFHQLLNELHSNMPPDSSPSREFRLFGDRILEVTCNEYSLDRAMEQWEINRAHNDECGEESVCPSGQLDLFD